MSDVAPSRSSLSLFRSQTLSHSMLSLLGILLDAGHAGMFRLPAFFLLAPLSSPAQFPSTSLASLKKLLIRSKEVLYTDMINACVKNSNLTIVIRISRTSYFTENIMAKKRFIRNEPKTYRFMKWSSRWVAIGACGTDDRTTV